MLVAAFLSFSRSIVSSFFCSSVHLFPLKGVSVCLCVAVLIVRGARKCFFVLGKTNDYNSENYK